MRILLTTFGTRGDVRRDAMLAALRANRLRGIVATGWGGLSVTDTPSDDVLVVDAVPHDWLFNNVAALVHHGGAGSTAAGLRAGKPSLICPFLGDQPFWGARMHAVGVGPEPLPAKKLPAELTGRLRDLVRNEGYRRPAARIGEMIRAVDGVGNGVTVVESLAPA